MRVGGAGNIEGDGMQYESIHVVRPGQFDSATAQTPGARRFAAIHPAAGIE
jgi:hypothetical protein